MSHPKFPRSVDTKDFPEDCCRIEAASNRVPADTIKQNSSYSPWRMTGIQLICDAFTSQANAYSTPCETGKSAVLAPGAKMSEATIDAVAIPATTSRLIEIGIGATSINIIFTPTNPSTPARPYFR